MTPQLSPEIIPETDVPTVLLVEPVPALARLLRGLMTDIGYQVIAVDGPDQALTEVENNASAIDLVISEFSLPDVSGPKLASFIRKQWPAMPILLLCDQPVPDHPRRRPPAVFLEKPFTRDQLAAVLERIAGKAA